jgi:cytochrome b pre-mRNA-processing protein 3
VRCAWFAAGANDEAMVSAIETGNPHAHFATVPSAGGGSLSTFAGSRFAATATAMISLARRKSLRDASELAYRRVVEQARQRVFFTEFCVPDTLDGRFELICLHAFLYLHRLKSERPRASALAQAFFDTMFADLDRALRELGTGDLRVGREVKRMAQGFYGRIRAYADGIAADDAVLGAALARNLFGTIAGPVAQLGAMARYVRRAADDLRRQGAAELLAGHVRFVAAALSVEPCGPLPPTSSRWASSRWGPSRRLPGR